MKNNEEMTLEEVKEEIRKFEDEKFDSKKPYVFVSYSHEDKETVWEIVLGWIRDGYNVAIDVDFENQSSDIHWIDIMDKRLRTTHCKKVVCFKSMHYCLSYACLIEFLLLKSEYYKSRDISFDEIDIIKINDPKRIEDNDELHNTYIKKYDYVTKNVEGYFFDKKQKEKDLLIKGLETLCSKNKDLGTPESCIQNFDDKFEDSPEDFYNYIYKIFIEGFRLNGLDGNDKQLEFDEESTFNKLNIYKHPVSSEKRTFKIKKENVTKVNVTQSKESSTDKSVKYNYIITNGKLANNNEDFSRPRLILNIIKEAYEQIDSKTYDELNNKLDGVLVEKIYGGRQIITNNEDKNVDLTRYYTKVNDIIKFDSKDWYVNKKDWPTGQPKYAKVDKVFNRILEIAKDKCGLEIEEVKKNKN